MTEKKMIEKYVILDVEGNIIENTEDINAPVNTLRIYDREKSATIIKVLHTDDKYFNLHVAKACVAACDEYTPEEGELNGSD